MESSTQKRSRRTGAKGMVLATTFGLLLALGAGVAMASSGGGTPVVPPAEVPPPIIPPGDDLIPIPEGPITDAEKAACEQVLAMKPQPMSYKDDQGRVWTPCVEWWLAKNIPNWPANPFPGQLPYLHKPADTAEWLGCIAGYLVYKDVVGKAISDPKIYKNEAINVDLTKRLSGRRDVLRAYVATRLKELGRVNAENKCDDVQINPIPPKPQPEPPSPDDLTFDLEANWGGIPMSMREWLAKAELASGIPGLARAAGVRWWESFRAKKEPVSTEEAKKIAAENPELARFFVNKNDGPKAKSAIDNDMAKQGWPKPVDYDGWIAGSFGLGDILGSTFVYSGIHTEGKKAGPNGLPFVYAASAKKQYESYEGQIAALAYIVYRVLYGPYNVLVPGVQAQPEVQDPRQTWINIFAAYAYPDSYKAKTQLAATAAANYKKRALEIGIDLDNVAYPWPPGLSYKTWDFSDFWARLQAYAPQKVTHLPSVMGVKPKPKPQKVVQQPSASKKFALQGNVVASIASAIPESASAPLVLFLHDRDADETQLAGLVPPEMVNARLAFLRGPIETTDGFRWFDADLGQVGDPSVALQIEAATNVVSAAGQELVKQFPGTSEVYVVGFGQGGAIAYRLAARGEIAKALPVAGGLPSTLLIGDKSTKTNVWAVHGQNDQIVPLPIDEATIESFIFKTPSVAKLTVVPGGTHTLASLQAQIGTALVEMLQ